MQMMKKVRLCVSLRAVCTLVVGWLLLDGAPVRAGHWEVTVVTEANSIKTTWSYTAHGSYGQTTNKSGLYTLDSAIRTNSFNAGSSDGRTIDDSPQSGIKFSDGKYKFERPVSAIVRWIRQPYAPESDDPPKYLGIKMFQGVVAKAYHNSGISGLDTSIPLTGTASLWADSGPLTLHDGKRSFYSTSYWFEPVKDDKVELPTGPIEAAFTTPGHDAGGSFGADIDFVLYPFEVDLTRPTPSHKPDSNPVLGFNEFVMGAKGPPFRVPATSLITRSGADAETVEFVRTHSDWILHHPLSGALGRDVNGKDLSHDIPQGVVFPQFRSDDPNDPDPANPNLGRLERELGFSTKNGLPLSNSEFGPGYLDYFYLGKKIATADLEIFYESTAYTHKVGNDKWCGTRYGGTGHLWDDELDSYGLYSKVPNWFHYYSQAYPSPVPIAYDGEGAFGQGRSWFNPDSSDHVHISEDAHGTYDLPLYERRSAYLYVRHVGYQKQYGIDNFVATVLHEYTHKRCHEAIQSGMADNDNGDGTGDGVPDAWEEAVGLNPNSTNSSDSDISDAPEYANIADQEVYCAMQARDVTGPREADWADDGLEHGTVPGPDPANRSAKSYFYLP